MPADATSPRRGLRVSECLGVWSAVVPQMLGKAASCSEIVVAEFRQYLAAMTKHIYIYYYSKMIWGPVV